MTNREICKLIYGNSDGRDNWKANCYRLIRSKSVADLFDTRAWACDEMYVLIEQEFYNDK